MKIYYKSRKIEKQLTNPIERVKSYGQKLARKISQRLAELESAENLEIMKAIPAARCHELKGKQKGKLAVKISENYRITFNPYHDPIPQKDDGGLDWTAVTKIQINEIVDYH